MQKIKNWLRDEDELISSFYERIHAGEETDKKTTFGGVMTLICKYYVYWIALN